ncbi:splicing regulator RBM11 [Crotalus adamanteus]|uniref:Splicing regulator RBM11 n=1 Tax=Crotalus adamanteus TaxID=8729 RepID=A0AAW1BIV5_CROAD
MNRATPALYGLVRSRRGPSLFAGFPAQNQNSRQPRLIFMSMTTQNRADEPDRTLFVGNLEGRVKEEILYELFLQVQERVRRVLWEVGVSGWRWWAWPAVPLRPESTCSCCGGVKGGNFRACPCDGMLGRKDGFSRYPSPLLI